MLIEIWLLKDHIFRDGQMKNVMFEVSKVGFSYMSRSSFTWVMSKFITALSFMNILWTGVVIS